MAAQLNKKRTSKVTLRDVAERAGVGPATVDRVINERGNVSEEIQRKAIESARELGLKRILPDSYRRHVRVEEVMARPELCPASALMSRFEVIV